MSEPDTGGAGTFPTKDIVLGSFSLPFGHFGLFLRSAWLSLGAFVVASMLVSTMMSPPPVPPPGNEMADLILYLTAVGGFFEVLAFEILTLLVLLPAITVWIRLTVYGPPEDGRFPLLSLGEAELQYLFAYIVVVVFSLAAMIGVLIASTLTVSVLAAVIGAASGGTFLQLASVVGSVLGLAAFIYVSARFVPALGATALGQPFAIRAGWDETKAQARPLFWSLVSFGGTLMLVQLALSLGFAMLLPSGVALLGGLIKALIQALGIMLACVYVGRVYAYFRT